MLRIKSKRKGKQEGRLIVVRKPFLMLPNFVFNLIFLGGSILGLGLLKYSSIKEAYTYLTVTVLIYALLTLVELYRLRVNTFALYPDKKVLRWKKRRFMSVASGVIPFEDIVDVRVDTSDNGKGGGSGGGKSRHNSRLALRTTGATITLPETFTENKSRCHEAVKVIESYLKRANK